MRAALLYYRGVQSASSHLSAGEKPRIGIAPRRAGLFRRTVGVPVLDQKPRTAGWRGSTQRRSADYIGIDELGRRIDKRTDRVQQLRLEPCNSRLQRASVRPKAHSPALFRSLSDYS